MGVEVNLVMRSRCREQTFSPHPHTHRGSSQNLAVIGHAGSEKIIENCERRTPDTGAWVYFGSCELKIRARGSVSIDYLSHVDPRWTTHPVAGIFVLYEPRHEKTTILVSDLVRHKPCCTATEDG